MVQTRGRDSISDQKDTLSWWSPHDGSESDLTIYLEHCFDNFIVIGGLSVCPKTKFLHFLPSWGLLSKLGHAKGKGYLRSSMLISFDVQMLMFPLPIALQMRH